MKLFTILLCSLPLLLPAADVTLLWDYPTNELGSDLTFSVYASTNIAVPLANWPVLTQVVGTATQVRVTMVPSRKFFIVTASNLWGESAFSNVTNTPSPATNTGNLRITRP